MENRSTVYGLSERLAMEDQVPSIVDSSTVPPHIKHLTIEGSQVERVTGLKNIQTLHINNCTRLTRIDNLPQLRELKLSSVHLKMLETQTSLEYLVLNASKIDLLHAQPKLLSLVMAYLTNVEVPYIPSIQNLALFHCENISLGRAAPYMLYLAGSDVRDIQAPLPFLSSVRNLVLEEMNDMQIPHIPNLEYITVQDCENIDFQNIDTLQTFRKIEIRDSYRMENMDQMINFLPNTHVIFVDSVRNEQYLPHIEYIGDRIIHWDLGLLPGDVNVDRNVDRILGV